MKPKVIVFSKLSQIQRDTFYKILLKQNINFEYDKTNKTYSTIITTDKQLLMPKPVPTQTQQPAPPIIQQQQVQQKVQQQPQDNHIKPKTSYTLSTMTQLFKSNQLQIPDNKQINEEQAVTPQILQQPLGQDFKIIYQSKKQPDVLKKTDLDQIKPIEKHQSVVTSPHMDQKFPPPPEPELLRPRAISQGQRKTQSSVLNNDSHVEEIDLYVEEGIQTSVIVTQKQPTSILKRAQNETKSKTDLRSKSASIVPKVIEKKTYIDLLNQYKQQQQFQKPLQSTKMSEPQGTFASLQQLENQDFVSTTVRDTAAASTKSTVKNPLEQVQKSTILPQKQLSSTQINNNKYSGLIQKPKMIDLSSKTEPLLSETVQQVPDSPALLIDPDAQLPVPDLFRPSSRSSEQQVFPFSTFRHLMGLNSAQPIPRLPSPLVIKILQQFYKFCATVFNQIFCEVIILDQKQNKVIRKSVLYQHLLSPEHFLAFFFTSCPEIFPNDTPSFLHQFLAQLDSQNVVLLSFLELLQQKTVKVLIFGSLFTYGLEAKTDTYLNVQQLVEIINKSFVNNKETSTQEAKEFVLFLNQRVNNLKYQGVQYQELIQFALEFLKKTEINSYESLFQQQNSERTETREMREQSRNELKEQTRDQKDDKYESMNTSRPEKETHKNFTQIASQINVPGFNTDFMLDVYSFQTFEAGMKMILPSIVNILDKQTQEKVQIQLLQALQKVIQGECGKASQMFTDICAFENIVQLGKIYEFCIELVKWCANE
ncbi:Conserved_hypothetical protein [Hexamita inflata]|uniref:Uncharacterized protein n=1 Tax=Hexamita inflata TaxID=28002 RepID=A0ABP1GYA4_9EUKA